MTHWPSSARDATRPNNACSSRHGLDQVLADVRSS